MSKGYVVVLIRMGRLYVSFEVRGTLSANMCGTRKIAVIIEHISVAAPHAACQGSLLSRCAAGAATKSSRAARLERLSTHVCRASDPWWCCSVVCASDVYVRALLEDSFWSG